MSDTRFSAQRLCPQCGAVLEAGAERCFLCRVQLGPPPQPAAREELPVPDVQRSSSVPLIVMLVLLGILAFGVVAPVFGMPFVWPLGFLILLVLVMLPLVARSWRGGMQPHSPRGVVTILATVVACGLAGFAAFFVTCWGGFFAGAMLGEAIRPKGGEHAYEPLGLGMLIAFIVGPACGIAVAIWLGRRMLRS